jgi:hypothetical protein
VDPSSCFPPLCLQFLRLHKLLWYLPAVLRQHSLTSSIHDLLGRLYPDSPSLFCGGILGACFRCRSLPTRSLRWGNIASSGGIHDLSKQTVLAAFAGSGYLSRSWRWVNFLSSGCKYGHLFHAQSDNGDFMRCLWWCNGRNGISSNCAGLAEQNRFLLDA